MAIKLLRPDFANNDPNGRLRLRREALTSCNFDHRNLVRLIDFGTSKIPIGEKGHAEFYDELYIVMELVKGETLKDYLARKEILTFAEAIDIAGQIAAGLIEVHNKGVVHRDLKPANIMLTVDPAGRLVVKVLDFGAVKLIGQSPTMPLPDVDLTGQMFIGSPHYSSPESCTFKSLDGRSDIYSLGLILYEMVAGRRPFSAKDTLQSMTEHAYKAPRPLVGVSGPLRDLIARTLSKLPGDRPQSAAELIADLREIKKALGPTVNNKAPAPENQADEEDEITRVGRMRSDTEATVIAKPSRPVVRHHISIRAIVAVLTLTLSVLTSLFLVLIFVRTSLRYARADGDTEQVLKTDTPGSDEFMTTTDVNIRNRPSGFSERVGVAEKGSRVRVLEKHKNWRRIIVVHHGRDKEDPAAKDEGWVDSTNLAALTDNPI
jgi:serine/threonine protein kinase